MVFQFSCSCAVSHVVTEYDSIEQTVKALKCCSDDISQVTVATSAWLSRCIKIGRILDVEDTDRVEPEKVNLEILILNSFIDFC